MKLSLLLTIITLLNIIYCEDITNDIEPSNQDTPSTTASINPNIITTEQESNQVIQEIQDPNTRIIPAADTDEVTGGGVWSSIGMFAVVICGCICLERLYSSCKKVYQKRTGRYGFSRLHNQTFNEFEDEDDEEDDEEENLGNNITKHTRNSDQDSV